MEIFVIGAAYKILLRLTLSRIEMEGSRITHTEDIKNAWRNLVEKREGKIPVSSPRH